MKTFVSNISVYTPLNYNYGAFAGSDIFNKPSQMITSKVDTQWQMNSQLFPQNDLYYQLVWGGYSLKLV